MVERGRGVPALRAASRLRGLFCRMTGSHLPWSDPFTRICIYSDYSLSVFYRGERILERGTRLSRAVPQRRRSPTAPDSISTPAWNESRSNHLDQMPLKEMVHST